MVIFAIFCCLLYQMCSGLFFQEGKFHPWLFNLGTVINSRILEECGEVDKINLKGPMTVGLNNNFTFYIKGVRTRAHLFRKMGISFSKVRKGHQPIWVGCVWRRWVGTRAYLTSFFGQIIFQNHFGHQNRMKIDISGSKSSIDYFFFICIASLRPYSIV